MIVKLTTLSHMVGGMAFMLLLLLLWQRFHRKLRYDYRQVWLQFSMMLFGKEDNQNVSQPIIKAIADTVNSQKGILFEWEDKRGFVLKSCWNVNFPQHDTVIAPCELTHYLQHSQRALELPDSDIKSLFQWAHLVVPLLHGNRLHAFIVLEKSQTKDFSLNWELLDILSMVGRQAVICLVQEQHAQALSVARQFEAYNQSTAFVMHDLKNVYSQLKLVQSNYERYKRHPEFLDSMQKTLSHVTEKVDRLLLQLRSRHDQMTLNKIDVASALNKAIELTLHRHPVPRLDWQIEETAISVMGDDERFVNILCHLIENAQQATPREGEVVLSVRCHNQNLKIDIQDTGCGMDPDFIHSSLYRPFVTTKGEKGTGIGVYEAKEYVSKVGGQLLVRSQKDKGSTFSLEIPLAYCT